MGCYPTNPLPPILPPGPHLVLSPDGGLFPALLRAPQELHGGHGFLVLVLSQQEAWGLGHAAHEQQHEGGGHTAQHSQPAPLQDPAWMGGDRGQSWGGQAWTFLACPLTNSRDSV